MAEKQEPEPLWTAEDVARYLNLHVQTVYERARNGTIPSHKYGPTRRFRRSEIEAMAVSHE